MSAITRHLVAHIDHTPLNISLRWSTTDPYAVGLDVTNPDDGKTVSWLFAWDLLEDGVDGPSGMGDVRIGPAGGGRTRIMLLSDCGRAELQVSTADLTGFLADTWVLQAGEGVEPPTCPATLPADFEVSP